MTENCNLKNKHQRDSRIAFEPTEHKYIVDGEVECESVTNIVADCFSKFDADYWAERKATAQCTPAMLKQQWEAKAHAARELGTQLHSRIERHYLGYEPEAEALGERAFRHFLRFASERPLMPYRTEWAIFSKPYRVAGTLDFLAYDGHKFEIYDWKRSTKVVDKWGRPILDNYGKYGLPPVQNIPDTTYHHYALQLSLYRYILLAEYGIEVSACHLGVFHPDMASYHVVDVPYLPDEVKAILSLRQ